MSIAKQVALTAVLLAAAVAVVVLVERWLARRRGPVEAAGSSADAQGIRPANSGPMMVLITIAAGCAAAAAVVGFVGQGQASERNASDDATVNRSTCLSTANADWRGSVGILLIGYTAGDDLTAQFVRAIRDQGPSVERKILDGARTPEQLRRRGAVLLAESAINDARISDEDNPLCPFVAGDPSRTPTEPDRARIEFDGTTAPDITTTTTAGGRSFGSCDEARAAGAAPLSASEGESWTDPGMDRDGDDIACE